MRFTINWMLVTRFTGSVVGLAVAASILSYADSSPTARRDKAMETITACLQSEAGRRCKNLNRSVDTLVDVYRRGDKSVLPTLFRFAYLTGFFDEALLSDPEGFLTAMTRLPGKDQRTVARGLAGGTFGLRSRERFEAIRALLANIPESSPRKEIAQVCLHALEVNNAVYLVTYFPPDTFAGRAADFTLSWYSRDMYALGEKPLWPASLNAEITYRFTKLGAFSGAEVVTLTIQPDGSGRFTTRALTENREAPLLDDAGTASQEQLAKFFTRLDQANFWNTPTEQPTSGRDGAEWILEGVQNGKYRVVVRWSPDIERKSAEEVAFADAAGLMFELAGHKQYTRH